MRILLTVAKVKKKVAFQVCAFSLLFAFALFDTFVCFVRLSYTAQKLINLFVLLLAFYLL